MSDNGGTQDESVFYRSYRDFYDPDIAASSGWHHDVVFYDSKAAGDYEKVQVFDQGT